MTCLVCQAQLSEDWSNSFGHFYKCSHCQAVWRDPKEFLSPDQEKARYLHHHNDLDDPNYQAYFRHFIQKAILPFLNLTQATQALDFGSGPQAVLGHVWQTDYQIPMISYDPFFANQQDYQSKEYDLITCVEVLEHLHQPRTNIQHLVKLMKPQAIIAIRTQFLPKNKDGFQDWWYMHDPSHVCFYNLPSLLYLTKDLNLDLVGTDQKSWISFRKQ